MQHFDKIYARASTRKGGDTVLEALLAPMRETINLTKLNDADVLAAFDGLLPELEIIGGYV